MFFIYRFLLDHRTLLLNVNCCVKVVIICMQQVPIEPHGHVIYCEPWCQIVCLTCFRFCTQPGCSRFSYGRDIFVVNEKRISFAHRLMSSSGICIVICTYVSIYGGMAILYLFYMYVQFIQIQIYGGKGIKGGVELLS